MDWIQVSGIVAAGGFIFAVIKFWAELREARFQRERDLRWRQAEAGKSLNDEMQDDQRAWAAMQMLDYGGREFKLPNEKIEEVSETDIRLALDPKSHIQGAKAIYIRDCFDNLFYYMAMLDHYTKSTLILEEDVAYPIEYYIRQMDKYRPEIEAYLIKYDLTRTRQFLSRYEGWHYEPPVERVCPHTPAP